MGWTYKEWYEENKEALSERRKRRYETDAEYRKQTLLRNQKAREERRANRTSAEAESKATRLGRGGFWVLRPEASGVSEDVYTIGLLAQILGVSRQTIRVWERDPEVDLASALRKGPEGFELRYYTVAQLETVIRRLREAKYITPKRAERGLAALNILRGGDLAEEFAEEYEDGLEVPGVARGVVWPDGTVRRVKLYRLGALAQAVGRSLCALGILERRGALPETPLRAARRGGGESQADGARLYTAEMIAAVREAFRAAALSSRRGKERQRVFSLHVHRRWQEIQAFMLRLATSDEEALLPSEEPPLGAGGEYA